MNCNWVKQPTGIFQCSKCKQHTWDSAVVQDCPEEEQPQKKPCNCGGSFDPMKFRESNPDEYKRQRDAFMKEHGERIKERIRAERIRRNST